MKHRIVQWGDARLGWASQVCADRCWVCMCVIYVLYGWRGWAVVAESRAHGDAIGQCTPVNGWMEVGTAGLVDIMPLELWASQSWWPSQQSRGSPLGCRGSCVRLRVCRCGCSCSERRPGPVLAPRAHVWVAECSGWRIAGVSGGRDGSPTRRRDGG